MNENGPIDATSVDSVKSWLIGWMAGELGMDHQGIDPSQAFLSYGMDSVQAMMLVGDLEANLGLRLPPTLAWDYPNIDALAEHLVDRLGAAPGPAPAAPAASRPEAASEASRAKVESLLAELDLLSDQDVDSLLEQYHGMSQ